MEKPKEICKLVYMDNGEPVECGGEIETESIYPPFTMNTPIGGEGEPPILTYEFCKKCKVMSLPA